MRIRHLAAVFATRAVGVLAPTPVSAQDELAAVMQIESGCQPAMMTDYFLGADRMCMDME